MKYCFLLLIFLLCVTNLYAQQQPKTGNIIHFIFQNKVGDSLLQSNSVYHNAFDEPFTVRSFKYYISDIKLEYNNGNVHAIKIPPHLVNEADSSSKILPFTAPAGKIKTIRFLLGIDSATNVSGVQTGDLDPAKGMFWIWNTGYIMAKLEGASAVSKAPGRQFSYDVGGYKPGENTAREITLSIPSTKYQSSTFIITTDITKWFQNKNSIKISSQPMCHSPGTLAMQIADNYTGMFSVHAQ